MRTWAAHKKDSCRIYVAIFKRARFPVSQFVDFGGPGNGHTSILCRFFLPMDSLQPHCMRNMNVDCPRLREEHARQFTLRCTHAVGAIKTIPLSFLVWHTPWTNPLCHCMLRLLANPLASANQRLQTPHLRIRFAQGIIQKFLGDMNAPQEEVSKSCYIGIYLMYSS